MWMLAALPGGLITAALTLDHFLSSTVFFLKNYINSNKIIKWFDFWFFISRLEWKLFYTHFQSYIRGKTKNSKGGDCVISFTPVRHAIFSIKLFLEAMVRS